MTNHPRAPRRPLANAVSLAPALALALAAVATPAAWADSTSSAASSASSASVGSISTSLEGSSASSTSPAKTAAGDYRIERIADAPDRPGMARVALRGADDSERGFVLVLPRATLEREGLARGDGVTVKARPYGLAFERADTRTAFFLALADDWQGEIAPRAVTL
jgi:hypothetical protein